MIYKFDIKCDEKMYLKPFINALRVKLVRARQHSERVHRLKVAHTDDAVGLVALVGLGVVFVGR